MTVNAVPLPATSRFARRRVSTACNTSTISRSSAATARSCSSSGTTIALADTSKEPWRRVPLAPAMPATLKLTKPGKSADLFIPNDGDEIVQTFADADTLELASPAA